MTDKHNQDEKLMREALSDAFDVSEQGTAADIILDVEDSQIEPITGSKPVLQPLPRMNSDRVSQVRELISVIEGVAELISRFEPEERVVIMSRFCPHCGVDWSSHDCECGFARSSESP